MIALDNNNYLALLLPIAFGADMLMTYNFMLKYRRAFPDDKRWGNSELNPIARWAWNKYGLTKGSMVAMLIASPVALMFSTLAFFSSFFFGVIVGTYLIVFRSHIYALRRLKQGIARKKSEEYVKKHPLLHKR